MRSMASSLSTSLAMSLPSRHLRAFSLIPCTGNLGGQASKPSGDLRCKRLRLPCRNTSSLRESPHRVTKGSNCRSTLSPATEAHCKTRVRWLSRNSNTCHDRQVPATLAVQEHHSRTYGCVLCLPGTRDRS